MERALSELVRHGHERVEFVVVASELQEDLRALARWERVRVPARPFPLRFAAFQARAGAVLRRTRADLVHTMGAIVPNRVDVAAVQFCHAAYLADQDLSWTAELPPLRRLNTTAHWRVALAAERWSYRPGRLRLFTPASEGVRRELARHFPGIPSVVAPNGVDTDRFRPDAEARARVRDELGVPPGAVLALFVGGDWKRKGLSVAIEGVGIARRAGADVRLCVVGPGDAARYGELAARAGAGDAVRFAGRRSDTPRFYAAADVGVLPSRYEAFPLVALEALASGLPLVATPINGIEDLVEDGEHGRLVAREPAAVGRALAELARDEAARRGMGAAGRRRAERFRWTDSAEAVLGAYGRLLGRAV
jgi:glycosyltransferase involved in cell wall biosynthesis